MKQKPKKARRGSKRDRAVDAVGAGRAETLSETAAYLLGFVYAPPADAHAMLKASGSGAGRAASRADVETHQKELRRHLENLAAVGAFHPGVVPGSDIHGEVLREIERAVNKPLAREARSVAGLVPHLYYVPPRLTRDGSRGVLRWEPAQKGRRFAFEHYLMLASLIRGGVHLYPCSMTPCRRVIQRSPKGGRPREVCEGECAKRWKKLYEASEDRRAARRKHEREKRKAAKKVR